MRSKTRSRAVSWALVNVVRLRRGFLLAVEEDDDVGVHSVADAVAVGTLLRCCRDDGDDGGDGGGCGGGASLAAAAADVRFRRATTAAECDDCSRRVDPACRASDTRHVLMIMDQLTLTCIIPISYMCK